MSVNPILEELKKRGYQVDPNSAYRIGNASGYRRAAAPYVKSYSDLLNERLQLGLQYAQQGSEYKKDLADSISPGGAMTSYKQGDISAFDWDTLKQAEMDRVAANTFYRSVGAFDNTDYAFNKGYVHLTSTDYLKSLLPSLEAARTAWNSGGEEDYLSFIQRNSAVKNKLADMDAQGRNYYDTDALTEADLLWFDQIINGNERWRPNYASQEDVDRYNSLVDQWASVEDWENFDLAQYLGIEAPKAYDESNYKTIISELERRAALEAMQADIRSNANYSSLSVYSDPGITPKNVSWAADREYEAYVKGYDDLSRFINSGAGWSELMTASDHNATVREYMSKGYDYISADELADYNALINAGRTEEAAQYLELLLPELQYRRAMVLKEYQSVKATNPWLAAPTWVEAGLQGIANVFYLPQQIYETATGKDNPWSSAWDAYNKQQWTGEAHIGAIHDADIPDWLKTVSTYAYQGVAGFRDNAMRILAGGGSPTVSLIIAGLQSGSGSLHESSERDDMSGAAKIIKAIGTAAVEMGTEKVGLDALFSNGKNGALAYMKKVILSEIGEEVLNAASEPVLEAVVAFLFDHEADIMSGPEFWKNLTDTAITTAISSVFMGAGGAVSQDMNTRAAGEDLKENGDLEGVLRIADSYSNKPEVSEPAKKIRDKQAKGFKVSNRDVGELVTAVSNAVGEKNSKVLSDVLTDSVEGRLEELGEDPTNARKLAQSISNMYLGKKITMAERAGLKWSDAASQVFKELNSTETVSKEVVPGAVAGTEGQLEDGRYVAGDAAAAEKNRVGHSWKTAADEKIVAAQRDAFMETARLNEALNTKTSTTTAVGKAHDKAKNLLKGKPKMATREVMAEGSDGKEVKGTFERVERKNGKLLMVMKDASDAEVKVDADKITNGGDEGILTIINYAQEGARHEMSADEVNTMVNTYLHEGGDVDSFVQQFQDNYLSGYSGVNAPAGAISSGIASIAYEQGKAEAIKDEADRVSRAQKARKVENPSVGWLGDVTSDTSIKGLGDTDGINEAVKNMTDTQQAMVEFGRHLAETAKINIAFFASKAGADGKYTTQNGSYDPNTHTIYLDINSGASTESGRQELMKSGTLGAAIGRVAGHELTHVLEATSPEYYGKYKQAVKAALKTKNLDYASLVREKIDAALATGEKLTYAGAEAEVIADASEYMLQDSKFVKNMDQGLKGKVKEIIQKFLNKVNEAFRILTGGHIESAVLRTMTDGVAHYEKQLQDLWDMAFDEMLGAEARTEAPVAEATGETETARKSIRERDDAYMAAVERGDMAAAQKMVDEAAKAAGYPVKAYHGTPTGGFTVFDRSYIGLNTGVGRGRFSFTSDKGTASAYAKANKGSNASTLVAELNKLFEKHASAEISELFLGDSDAEVVEFDPDIVIAEGALDHGYIDFDYDWRDESPDKYSSESEAKEAEAAATFNGTKLYLLDDLKRMQRGAPANTKAFFEEAIRMLETASMNSTPQTYSVYIKRPGATYSADASTYNSTAWDAAYDPNDVTEVKLDNGESRYFVSSPESIKSADPVTYDDSGSVIPLSERFNAAKEDIRYSLRNVDHSEATLQENMRLVQKMNPVARLRGNEFKMGKTLKADVKKYYASIGGAAHSPLFGQIILSNSGIKDSLGHGMGPVKAVMYHAVPNVISDGKMIDYRDNWKNRGYDTALIAAPVSIKEGEYKGDYWVGVILNLYADSTQRFYVHEPIVVQKRSAPVVQTGTPEGATPGNEDSSIISILDKLNEVKQEIKETDTDDSSPDGIEIDDDTESAYPTQKSIRDLPEDTVTYREFISAMQPTSRMNETEKLLLKRYKENIRILDEKEKLIEEQERIIETATGDELTKAKNRLDIYRTQANRARRALTAAERDNGFARLMATAYSTLNRIPVGAADNVADATDALEKDIANLTSQLKTIEATVSRTATGQKAAFARGLFDRKQLNTVAQALKDTYGSRMSTASIADRLALAYSEIYADSGADGAKRFSEAARSLAEDLIRNNKYRFHSDLLPMLTESIGAISLSETDIQEIKNAGLTVRQYKAMLAPYVKVTANGSDLSSYVSNAEYYGNGTLASIFGDGSEGDYAMKLYETISNEKAKEADNGFEGRSEGQLTMDAMADIAGSILPLADNSNAFAQLRSEMLKYAGENAESARAVSTAIERAKSASRKATSVWHAAVKDATLARQAVEYYRNLEEQRRVVELLEQKQLLTEQLRGEAGKLLKESQEKYQRQIDEIRLRRDINIEIGKRTRHIKRIVKRLNDRIIHEEDYKNVKEPLKPAVIRLVKAFIDGFGNLVFYNPSDEAVEKGTKPTIKARENYEHLKSLYDKLADDDGAPEFYSDDVANWLTTLAELARQDEARRTSGSTLENLNDKLYIYTTLSDIVDHVAHMVTAADTMFIEGKKAEASAVTEEVGNNLAAKKDRRELAGWAGKLARFADNLIVKGNMMPQFFFEGLNNKGMMRLYDDLQSGVRKYSERMLVGDEFLSDVMRRHGYHTWGGMKKPVSFKTKQGHTIYLTRENMMWIYATAKREASNPMMDTHHLDEGGITYEEIPTEKGRQIEGKGVHHLIVAEDVAEITKMLTAEQIAYVDECVEFLSTECAEWGNEASLNLFGIKKYKEGYYFPFKVDSGQLHKNSAAGATSTVSDARVKHISFSHSIKKGANTPLVMGNFTSVIADHINQMATYSGMVVPIENMNRVLNRKVDDGRELVNIRSLIARKHGDNTSKYIDDLLKDLNGGPQTDNRGSLDAGLRLFKRNAVVGKLSVAVQQPTAITRAFAYISPRWFANLHLERPKHTWDRMMKYSSATFLKDMGGFNVGMGKGAANWLERGDLGDYRVYKRAKFLLDQKSFKDAVDEWNDFLTGLPGFMDKITWCAIWNAAENEQAHQHPGMDRNSEKFLEMVGRRFDDIVNHTQVYDSILSKSQNMRSKNAIAKMATSFMAESTLNMNLAYRAIASKDGKQIAKVTASLILNAVLGAAAYALIGAFNKDDDDRTLEEKYATAFAGRLADNLNPLASIPYLSDLWNKLQGYDVERTDLSFLFDLIEDGGKFWNKMTDPEETLSYRDYENFVGGLISTATGIPAKNWMGDARRIWNMTHTSTSDAPFSSVWYGILDEVVPGRESTSTAYYERYLSALRDGDKQEQYDLKEFLTKTKGTKEDAITEGVRNAYKTEYQRGGIDKQTAIKFLLDNNLVSGETADKKKQKAFQFVDKWDEGTEGYSAYNTLTDALAGGNTSSIQTAWKELTSNGYNDKQVKTQVKTLIKELVQEKKITAAQATTLLKKWSPYEKDKDNQNKPLEWLKENK